MTKLNKGKKYMKYYRTRNTTQNKKARYFGLFRLRMTGIEPARHGHQILSLARLPVPPHPRTLIRLYFARPQIKE